MTEKLEMLRLENMKQCGFGVEAMKEVKVCRECGSKLPDKTLYDIYKERHTVCPACDTVVASDSDYCPQCGTKIGTKNEHKVS